MFEGVLGDLCTDPQKFSLRKCALQARLRDFVD
nr:MAG TPA: hypothetical protein [Caudoviricetes sp.]